MARQYTAEKNAKSDPIFCNRLVNMVANHIMKEEKHYFLIKFTKP
jgi:hypothetical protein